MSRIETTWNLKYNSIPLVRRGGGQMSLYIYNEVFFGKTEVCDSWTGRNFINYTGIDSRSQGMVAQNAD